MKRSTASLLKFMSDQLIRPSLIPFHKVLRLSRFLRKTASANRTLIRLLHLFGEDLIEVVSEILASAVVLDLDRAEVQDLGFGRLFFEAGGRHHVAKVEQLSLGQPGVPDASRTLRCGAGACGRFLPSQALRSSRGLLSGRGRRSRAAWSLGATLSTPNPAGRSAGTSACLCPSVSSVYIYPRRV